MKKMCVLMAAVALFFTASLGAADETAAAAKKAGTALLDAYVQTFKEMAEKGTAKTIEALEQKLQNMAAEAKKAAASGEIDAYFLAWYQRILAMTKLFIAPDPGMVLKPVIDNELADFLKDTLGQEPEVASGPDAVGLVARALATEVVNLQVYLDTEDNRDALMKKLGFKTPVR